MQKTIFSDDHLTTAWRRLVRHITFGTIVFISIPLSTVSIIAMIAVTTELSIISAILIGILIALVLLGGNALWFITRYIAIRKALTKAVLNVTQKLYVAEHTKIRLLMEDPIRKPGGFIYAIIMASTDVAGEVYTSTRQITYDGTTHLFLEHQLIGLPNNDA